MVRVTQKAVLPRGFRSMTRRTELLFYGLKIRLGQMRIERLISLAEVLCFSHFMTGQTTATIKQLEVGSVRELRETLFLVQGRRRTPLHLSAVARTRINAMAFGALALRILRSQKIKHLR